MYEKQKTKEGYNITFQKVSFFTQVQNGNATNNGNAVAFIDFSNLTDKAKAEIGTSVTFDIATGTYNSLDLGIGVPSASNKMKPADFKSSNPLSETGEYWEAWKSYIFTRTEGSVDTSSVASNSFKFSYHTGTDEMFRTVNLAKSFTIEDAKNTTIVLELDVKELLDGKSGAVNPLKEQNAHSLANKTVALKISDNYKTALKLK
jgi:hypothetical protein